MLKDKKKQKVPDRPLSSLYSAEDIPSQNCKDFLIELIVRYYEEINLRTLESMYVRYREKGPEMFKHDMHVQMTEHLMAPNGMLITRKGPLQVCRCQSVRFALECSKHLGQV